MTLTTLLFRHNSLPKLWSRLAQKANSYHDTDHLPNTFQLKSTAYDL